MRLCVVGLGPGPAAWVSDAARAALRAPGARVFARTRLHPALAELLDGHSWESFDALYEQAERLDEVYAAMTSRLLAAGQDAASDVVLAVPGDGALGEAILGHLRAAGVEPVIIPGVPLGVGALAAAGLEVADGVQSVEATSLGGSGIGLHIELNPRWPAVCTGVFSPRVAADLKLALQRVYPAEHPVWLVAHPGLDDQQTRRLPLAELDRTTLSFDHLTHLVVPPVPEYAPTGSAHQLRAIVARLRAPEIGCPWDLEQTHQTLIRYVIEEAYEVVDAIENGSPAELADELGDLLLQVTLHAEIADQAGEFEWNDVVRTLAEKLVRRHPHVFGSVQVSGAADVVRNWDQLKAAERGEAADDAPPRSALAGIARSLPALKRAAEMAHTAAKTGFDWPTRDGTLDKVREELAELLAAERLAERREELGDLLWILAKLATDEGIDPELALQAANQKFARRFATLEQVARERRWPDFTGRPIDDLLDAWAEAKRRTRA